jgi:hypothetical protein
VEEGGINISTGGGVPLHELIAVMRTLTRVTCVTQGCYCCDLPCEAFSRPCRWHIVHTTEAAMHRCSQTSASPVWWLQLNFQFALPPDLPSPEQGNLIVALTTKLQVCNVPCGH